MSQPYIKNVTVKPILSYYHRGLDAQGMSLWCEYIRWQVVHGDEVVTSYLCEDDANYHASQLRERDQRNFTVWLKATGNWETVDRVQTRF